MKKTKISAFVSTALLAGTLGMAAPAQAQGNFSIDVEDKSITFSPEPFLLNDRLMVPLRSLSEALGADVNYDGNTHTATIIKDDITLFLDFKTGNVTKNGAPVSMNPAPQLVNDRTMVPLRFISEAFTNKVDWNSATNKVTVFPSESTLKKRDLIKEINLKSSQAVAAKDSYQLDMTLNGQFGGGPFSVKMDGQMLFDYHKTPFVMHGTGQIKAAAGLDAQTADLNMYIADGVIYMQDPVSKQWIKTTFMSKQEWEKLMQIAASPNAQEQAAQLASLLPYMKLKETTDSYQLITSLNGPMLQKLVEGSQQPVDPSAQEALKGFNNMTITVTVDKQTFLQTGIDFDMDMTVPGAGAFKMAVAGKVKNYNNVPAITIPQSVINSAVEQSGTPFPLQ